jgi:uncharacterized RDD family membrane protein YckC
MAWHYVINGESKGPVGEPELQGLRAQNIILADTPVWTDGMTEWVPYRLSRVADGGVVVATAPGIQHACAECGRLFPEDEMLHYENSWVCATCKPLFFQRIKEGVVQHGTMDYVGFWRRFAAVFIDGIIIDIVVFLPLIFMVGFQGLMRHDTPIGTRIFILFMQYVVPSLFEIIFIGKFAATPGKMAMGIKVVTADGGRVGYLRATGRHYAKLINIFTLMIGYLMVVWDDEKRALHDRICNTRVIFAHEA